MNSENEKTDPLISVIVPIYNVEKYVRKCLESLRGQTLREIEVICIDDGSTDRSREIADEYESRKFPIFRVIHTENRGLSAARNRGLDEARTEWIMFVDSDDWVDRDFCRIPYEAAIENQADMVIFDYYIEKQKGKPKRTKSDQVKSGIVSSKSVIRNCGAWNKLYKRSLFKNIRYPEGRVYEDIAMTHKIIYRAERIYRCEENLYYYRIRNGSISKSGSSRADGYAAEIQRYKDLTEWGYVTKEDKTSLQITSLDYCGQAESTDEKLYLTAVDIVEGINEDLNGFDFKHRLKFVIWRLNRNFYRSLYHVFGKQMT